MIKTLKLWDGEMPLGGAGNPHENEMTAFLLEDGKVHPAVVIYPGGAYHHYGPAEQETVAQFYNDHGFHAFIVYYRIHPNRHPAPLMDAQRGVKLVRYHADEWNVDADKVFALGFSAGGHLCGCVATMEDAAAVAGDGADAMSARPTAAILGYPVITADLEKTHAYSFECLLGENWMAEKDAFSLENRVTEDTCPCFMWTTLEDTAVPPENALRFAVALREKGIQGELHVFAHGIHGIGLSQEVTGLRQWPMLSVEWLDQFLH